MRTLLHGRSCGPISMPDVYFHVRRIKPSNRVLVRLGFASTTYCGLVCTPYKM